MRLVLACAALLAVAAAPAGAADVSPERFAELAARARSSPAALEELERVDSVGGRPVDLERALEGASGPELDRRLATLAEGGEATPLEPAVRSDARAILAEGRFHEGERFRPLEGFLSWVGDRLRPIGDAFDWVAERIPGGGSLLWALIGGAVALAAAFASLRLIRRREGRAVDRGGRRREGMSADPERLEREADDAERRGELERALRLRFRAGLLRLDRAHAIAFRDSLTSGEVGRALGSRDFDRIAADFDEVVYGGRPPEPADLTASRTGWTKVLEEARTR